MDIQEIIDLLEKQQKAAIEKVGERYVYFSFKEAEGILNFLKQQPTANKELLEACLNSPASNMFALFANFAEECFTKPSMAVYRNKFNGLATFLRSCEKRAEKREAAITRAKKEAKVIEKKHGGCWPEAKKEG